MERKTKELVKAGHELVVLLGNQRGMIDAASLVQRLTAQLDITAAALREMTKKRDDEHADVLAWEKTMFKVCGEDGTKSVAAKFSSLEAERDQLAAENVALTQAHRDVVKALDDTCFEMGMLRGEMAANYPAPFAPVTDAWQREQMAKAHKEGAYFVANRMLAAWESGFIEDTAKNAADIARMILTSTEFMADAPEGDFDRSFADGVLEDIAAQLRNGEAV